MMDILHSFGVDFRLLFIQIVNFAVVFVVLWKFLYIPLLDVMEKRKKEIEEGLDNAQKAKKELEEIHKKEDEIITQARKEAQSIADKAKQSAEEKSQEILTQAKDKADSLIKEAEQKALAQKEEILSQSKQEIAKAAILAASRILGKDNK